MYLQNSKRTKLLGLSLALVAILVLPSQGASIPLERDCLHEYHWLEAECGDIVSPGEIGADPEASDARYLTTAAGSGRFINQVAGPLIARYDYTLDADCHNTYYLWARIKYDSYLHNSLWVAFDHSADFPWRFSDQQTEHWHWERLGSITGLGGGDHQLDIKLREEQVRVDKFFMTSDVQFIPEGLGDPADNRCSELPPGEAEACDLCDPQINLGDLVILKDPYFPNDAYNGWPAIVVGQEAGHYALLTHRELLHRAPYAKSQALQGQGFPYDWSNYRVIVPHSDPYRHTIIVPEHSLEQYIDCRGLLSFHWDQRQGAFTGSFRSAEGYSGDLEIMPGVMPDGLSLGDNDNMRLQGMLHGSENKVFYPLVSSTLHPLGREGEVVIREILNDFFPEANAYGLGVIECWNLDRPGFSKIISLTDLVGSLPLSNIASRDSFAPPSDSERLSCTTVHLRPAVMDFPETGSFISYVCSDCGVIRPIDRFHNKYKNGKMSDSDYALVFEATGECYVLPQGLHSGSWADLAGQHYRLAGFREYAGPAGTGFGQVIIGGVNYTRLGFLAAPVVALPCSEGPVSQYTLAVSSDDGGHVTPAEGSFTFDPDTSVTLAAVADLGYVFSAWTITDLRDGTVKPDNPRVSFTMNGNYRFHATFKRIPVTHTLSVSSDIGGHVLPAVGTSTHIEGTGITLTAVADPAYAFDGWKLSGVPAGTVNPTSATVSFAVNGDYSFLAKFKRLPVIHTLKVSSDPGGRVLPAEGSFTYDPGTWVALFAMADPGYLFDGWTLGGVPAGTVEPADVMVYFAMNGNYSFRAKFKRIPVIYTLNVSSDAGGHVLPAEGTSTHNEGTLVTLTAVADRGYAFDGWKLSGVPAGAVNPAIATVSLTINGDYSLLVKFRLLPVTHTLKVSSDHGGRVLPAEGNFTYDPGTWVALFAMADPGYTFERWTVRGVPSGTVEPTDVMVFFAIHGDYSFHAKFKRIPVTYTLSLSSDTGGHVLPAEGTSTHIEGTSVTLAAVADPGYAFDGWSLTGVPAGTVNPASATVSLAMNGNYTFHAKFARVLVPVPTTYTMAVSSDAGGHVVPNEGRFSFDPGTWVAFLAAADPGYTFDGWVISGLPAGAINPADAMVFFPMNGNYGLHARFTRNQVPVTYVLGVSADEGGHVLPSEGSFTHSGGTVVTLTAVPVPGYGFDRWVTTGIPAGVINPADATVSFAVNDNTTCHAIFRPVARHLANLLDGGLIYQDIHPQMTYSGGTVNVSFRLMNSGSATAVDGSGLIRIAFFASSDTTITTSDHYLGDEFTWSLPAGQSRDITVPLKLPESCNSDAYYVGWIIDPLNAIEESNENDNVAFKQSKKLMVQ